MDRGDSRSILELMRSDGYITVNKKLARVIGLHESIIYGELVSRYFYFAECKKLTDDGYFFNTIEDLEAATTLSEKQQRRAINTLKKFNLLKSIVRGIPAKRYFRINSNADVLSSILSTKSVSLKSQQLRQKCVTCSAINTEQEPPKWQGNKNNSIRINQEEQLVSGKVTKAQTAGADLSMCDAPPLIFEKKQKDESIFERATRLYGEEHCREALRIVNEFIDVDYPNFRKKRHPSMNKAQRMAFAIKICACENETGVEPYYIENAMYHALQDANCEPTILYTTTPKVLGYWLIQQDDVGYDSINGTEYEPVESYY